jgi:dihydrofolate reductase
MRHLIFFMHTSLDGFVAGLNGEMDWIYVDDAMFDFVATMTNQADTALYGRVTYEMMQSYWPKAGEQPNASKHDKEHSKGTTVFRKLYYLKLFRKPGFRIPKLLATNFRKTLIK